MCITAHIGMGHVFLEIQLHVCVLQKCLHFPFSQSQGHMAYGMPKHAMCIGQGRSEGDCGRNHFKRALRC